MCLKHQIYFEQCCVRSFLPLKYLTAPGWETEETAFTPKAIKGPPREKRRQFCAVWDIPSLLMAPFLRSISTSSEMWKIKLCKKRGNFCEPPNTPCRTGEQSSLLRLAQKAIKSQHVPTCTLNRFDQKCGSKVFFSSLSLSIPYSATEPVRLQ